MSSYTTPSLSYLSSVDLSTSNGATLYNIQFDEAMVNDGNILMFEYKIQEYTLANLNPTPTDQNVTLGFVNLENCNFTSGVANVWQISVPVLDNDNLKNISVRVYVGLTGSTGIAVSEWSNTLAVYNPPAQPVVHMSYYDSPSVDNGDELFVLMNVDNSHSNNVRYIVAYYYTNDAGDIVWAVSEQLEPSSISHLGTPYKLLHVVNFGKVSQSSRVLYAAVYAVLPFTYDNKNYYSVSKISDTVGAEPSVLYNAPTITSIDYTYSIDTLEVAPMTINWTAPVTAAVNTFHLDKYILSVSVNGGQWQIIDNNISKTASSYVYDVTNYGPSDLLNFKMHAVSTYGSLSPESNKISKYTFKFSTAPLDLEVSNTAYSNEDGLSLTVKFKNPSNIGYGSGRQFVVVLGDNVVESLVTYDASAQEYVVNLANLNHLSSGYVTVYLQTQDTNSTDLLGGYRATAPYASANFVIDSIVYDVYTNRSQNMNVSWNSFVGFVKDNWAVVDYKVYLTISGLNPVSEQLIATTTNTSIVYTATQAIGNTLTFRVVATLSNGSLTYSINSSSLSKNIFIYPTIAGNLTIEYATILVDSNNNNSGVTISALFDNNANSPQIYNSSNYWVVEVFDNTYNPVASNNVISSDVFTYDGNKVQYNAIFNNIQFLSSGYVNVYLVTADTNSSNMLNGAASFTSFTSSRLPVPTPPAPIVNTNRVSFIVNTLSLLTPSGTLWVNFTQMPFLIALYSSYTYNPNNGIYKYEFILDPNDFGLSIFPQSIYVLVSNQTGPIITFLGTP